MISVRDEGVGIPEDELDKLFGRFFRASTSVGIPGSGIGLHLIKHLVEMHGGAIDVASEVDRGSTFFVRLPIRCPVEQGACCHQPPIDNLRNGILTIAGTA